MTTSSIKTLSFILTFILAITFQSLPVYGDAFETSVEKLLQSYKCPLSLAPCIENGIKSIPISPEEDAQCAKDLQTFNNNTSSQPEDFPPCACPFAEVYISCTLDKCKEVADIYAGLSDTVCLDGSSPAPTSKRTDTDSTPTATPKPKATATATPSTAKPTATDSPSPTPVVPTPIKPNGAAGRGGFISLQTTRHHPKLSKMITSIQTLTLILTLTLTNLPTIHASKGTETLLKTYSCPLTLATCMDEGTSSFPSDPDCDEKLKTFFTSTGTEFPSCGCPTVKVYVGCTQEKCKALADTYIKFAGNVCFPDGAAPGVTSITDFLPTFTESASASANPTSKVTSIVSTGSPAPASTGAATTTNTGASKPSAAAEGASRNGFVAIFAVLLASIALL
ncbi:hypothetical protein HDU97_000932 [Phlyctochytrium planicorne]|nr:hypothetical protein HDU97_000932 [Phlyctochytrium planicorne]